MIRLPVFLTAFALIGCKSSGNIWLVEVETSKGDGFSCSTKGSTNYDGTLATQTDSSGPITETYESMSSNILFYVKIVETDKSTATLNSGDLLLPGKAGDGDKWTFEWADTDLNTQRTEHDDGYLFEYSEESVSRTTVVITIDGDTAKGSMTVADNDVYTMRESDTWSEEVADQVGRSGRMGWSTEEDGYESNSFEESDCTDDVCKAEETRSCGATAPLVASRTDLSDDGDFASLVGLVNYGSFKTSSSTSYGDDTGHGGWDSGWAEGR